MNSFQGHSSFVTHMDWSLNGHFLRSTSGDLELLYCKTNVFKQLMTRNSKFKNAEAFVECFAGNPSVCRQITSASQLRNEEWATETCTIGFCVLGEQPGKQILPTMFIYFIYWIN